MYKQPLTLLQLTCSSGLWTVGGDPHMYTQVKILLSKEQKYQHLKLEVPKVK